MHAVIVLRADHSVSRMHEVRCTECGLVSCHWVYELAVSSAARHSELVPVALSGEDDR